LRSRNRTVVVPAAPAAVWTVLTDPALTRSCLLGLAVESSFEVGADIRFHGPAGSVVGGRILACEPNRLLAHSLGDVSSDLVTCGLEDHDPTCWVTWKVDAVSTDPPSSTVQLTVDDFDDFDDADEGSDTFNAWCGALSGLQRVLTTRPDLTS
jgi:uncharacterized protein YndB with AHSA1/START domain